MILDESDITLVLNPKYQKFLEFDNKKQKIKIVDKRYWDEEKKKRVRLNLPDDIPEELKPFVVQVKNEEKKRDYEPEHHYFIDTKKYFFLFIETTDAVFPADITHSMKFVSLKFIFLSFPIGY